MAKDWWKESVVYQIYPRSFNDTNGDGIGDIPGITQRLPYLKELGVDVIWLCPVYQSPNDDNGYDVSDYRAILPEFGTMEDFDELLEAAHSMGLKIVMDLVVNHSSDEHPWFVESRQSRDNDKRDYYIWRDGKDGKEPNDWGACFGGSAWQYDEETDQYYLHLFSVKQPDLNWENPAMRQDVSDMMTWWCEKGIDGFRMDTINLISKPEGFPDVPAGPDGYGFFGTACANGPHVHEYLREMNREVLSHYDLMTVGECAMASVEEAVRYASLKGDELNMVFQSEVMDLDNGPDDTKWCDKKIRLTTLKQTLSKWQTGLHGKAWNSLFWDNHDQPRCVSRFGNDDPKYREVSAKMLATCLHMLQGTPYIFQGEELGMTNYPFTDMSEFRDLESLNACQENLKTHLRDQEDLFRCICYRSRDNARTPMQWDDSENAGFTTGTPWINVNPNYKKINAKEQVEREDSVFYYYQKLIGLRKTHPVIIEGDYRLLLPDSEEIYAYIRTYENTKLLVVCNFTEQKVSFCLPEEFAGEEGEVLISNCDRKTVPDQFEMEPYEAVVYEV